MKFLFQADPSWKVFNVLQEAASQVAALDLGYKGGISNLKEISPKVLYLLGADDSDVLKEGIPADTFVIYQGLYKFLKYCLFSKIW